MRAQVSLCIVNLGAISHRSRRLERGALCQWISMTYIEIQRTLAHPLP